MGCGLLGPPPVPIFWYINNFDLEKNKERTFGTKRRRLEAELGQENFCPLVERFRRGTSLPEGKIIFIIITNYSPILGRAVSINIFTSTISSQTLVHLLYPIFVSKPQIGTRGLLVVLITPCS